MKLRLKEQYIESVTQTKSWFSEKMDAVPQLTKPIKWKKKQTEMNQIRVRK